MQEQFITAKYVDRRYAAGAVPAARGVPQTFLWDAVEGGSIRQAQVHAEILLSDLLAGQSIIYIYLCLSLSLCLYS